MKLQQASKLTLTVLAIVGLVAGCGTSASPTPAATASPASESTWFTGIFTCTPSGSSATDCVLQASDPRASGTEHVTLTLASLPDGSTRAWSTSPFSHKSAGGTWECTNAGTITPGGLRLYDGVCRGQDAFAKLLMGLHTVGFDDSTFYVTGWIQPAS